MNRDSVAVWPPIPGLYTTRLVKGGPLVTVRIWFGNAIIDGEEQDRGHDWRVEIDGKTCHWEKDDETGYRCRVPLHVDRAWPYCLANKIDRPTYDYMRAHADWAKSNAPSHPSANPRQAVDLSKTAPIF